MEFDRLGGRLEVINYEIEFTIIVEIPLALVYLTSFANATGWLVVA
jgi:hypothetical protein